MTTQYLSFTDYAKHRCCDRAAIYRAASEGRIDVVVIDGKKRIDPAVADAQWEANTRARGLSRVGHAAAQPSAGAASSTVPSYNDSRARREQAEAEEAEIRVARAAGRALDRERAEKAAFDSFRELRDAVFIAVKKQARRVQGLVEVREIELALEDEVRAAFAGWEDRMQQRLQQAADV
jgi:hypothetical protein